MIKRYLAKARHVRFWKQFVHSFFAAVGVPAFTLGLWALFYPDLFKRRWWVFVLVGVAALCYALWVERPRVPEQRYTFNSQIRVVIGDLFDEHDANLMIGMASTFDTSIVDGIISRDSVQGQFLERVYGGSQARLDAALEAALSGRTPVGTIIKPGKQTFYPIGTVAVLSATNDQKYFCVAYTDMDTDNRAQGTIAGMLDSLNNVWDACDKHGNGRPICVPLIGQGLSRIPELTAEVSLRLIAFSFLLRSKQRRFTSELRLILAPSAVDRINMEEFQAFLRSLAEA